MRNVVLVALLNVVSAAGFAHAQTTSDDDAEPARVTAPSEERSVAGAVGLSVLGTAAGIAAVAAVGNEPGRNVAGAAFGFLTLSFGPSLGEIYGRAG